MKIFEYIENKTAEIYWREAGIAKQFISHIDSDDSVLDVGAGSGKLAQYLIDSKSSKVQLVDVVDHNNTKLPLRLYDGAKLPYADASFDICMLVFVLHHASDPELLLQEVKRVSKHKIIIVEDTPINRFEMQAWEKWDYYLNHGHHDDIAVAHEARSPHNWRDVFAQAGLSVTAERQFRTMLPVLGMYQHTAFVLDNESTS